MQNKNVRKLVEEKLVKNRLIKVLLKNKLAKQYLGKILSLKFFSVVYIRTWKIKFANKKSQIQEQRY